MPREFEISTPIDGSADEAWAALTRFEDYSKWSRLLPFASGTVVPGTRLDLRIRGPGRRAFSFHPRVVSVNPPHELVLDASVGHRSFVHMVHSFTFVGCAETGVQLRQRWVATGILVPVLWPLLRRAMARFNEFGTDLSARVAASS
jgi:hypothetical protein